MTGVELQTAIIELAHTFGWRIAHFRPAQTKHGWRTPVAADGKGWPDLVLVAPWARTGGILHREIKGAKERLTAEQEQWGTWLTGAGADWAVWRPADWPTIVDVLTSGKGKVA